MSRRLTMWWHGRWTSTGEAARSGAQHMQRLAAQAPARARNAGRKLAGKVITIQEMAGLDQGPAHLFQRDPVRLMQRSALSVISRPAVRASEAAWREGYRGGRDAPRARPRAARQRRAARPGTGGRLMLFHEPRRARRRWQQVLSDRVHAAGDTVARSHGWTVTVTSTRSGFGGRVYCDPRFGPRSLAESSTGKRRPGPVMVTGCDAPGDLSGNRRPHHWSLVPAKYQGLCYRCLGTAPSSEGIAIAFSGTASRQPDREAGQ